MLNTIPYLNQQDSTPLDSFSHGWQTGQLMGTQLQQQAAEAEAVARKKEMYRKNYDILQKPNLSSQEINEFIAENPEMGKAMASSLNGVAQDKRDTYYNQWGIASEALKNDRPDLAKEHLTALAKAKRDAGDEQQAVALETKVKMIDSNPVMAGNMIGLMMSQLNPEAYDKYNKVANDAYKAELDGRKTIAETNKIGADIAIDKRRVAIDAKEADTKAKAAERSIYDSNRNYALDARKQNFNEQNGFYNAKNDAEKQAFAQNKLSPAMEAEQIKSSRASTEASIQARNWSNISSKISTYEQQGGVGTSFADKASKALGLDTVKQDITMMINRLILPEALGMFEGTGTVSNTDLQAALKSAIDPDADIAVIKRAVEIATTAATERAQIAKIRAEWIDKNRSIGSLTKGTKINGIPLSTGMTLEDVLGGMVGKGKGRPSTEGGVTGQSLNREFQ